jgi:hypothetical protein
VSKDDDLRVFKLLHAQAEEARARADHLDDVVAKAQMIDRADNYDLMAERFVGPHASMVDCSSSDRDRSVDCCQVHGQGCP